MKVNVVFEDSSLPLEGVIGIEIVSYKGEKYMITSGSLSDGIQIKGHDNISVSPLNSNYVEIHYR